MINWKSYLGNRLIAEKEGFFVIVPKDRDDSIPLFCELCEGIMRSELDEESHKKFNCCDSCATFWAYPNKEKWKEGWRPTSEEVMNKYKIDHT